MVVEGGRKGWRRRGRRRGATTLEFVLLGLALGVPCIIFVTLAGAKQFREYKQARDYMLQAFP